MFIRYYKIDPYSMMDHMTMMEFQGLLEGLRIKNQKDQEDKTSDKLMKCLISIRDMLNYMTLPVK